MKLPKGFCIIRKDLFKPLFITLQQQGLFYDIKKEYTITRILRLRRDTKYHFPFRRSAILAKPFLSYRKNFPIR